MEGKSLDSHQDTPWKTHEFSSMKHRESILHLRAATAIDANEWSRAASRYLDLHQLNPDHPDINGHLPGLVTGLILVSDIELDFALERRICSNSVTTSGLWKICSGINT
jgi:hypothetical protein